MTWPNSRWPILHTIKIERQFQSNEHCSFANVTAVTICNSYRVQVVCVSKDGWMDCRFVIIMQLDGWMDVEVRERCSGRPNNAAIPNKTQYLHEIQFSEYVTAQQSTLIYQCDSTTGQLHIVHRCSGLLGFCWTQTEKHHHNQQQQQQPAISSFDWFAMIMPCSADLQMLMSVVMSHFADDYYYLFYHSQSKLQKQYLPEFLQNIAVYMVVSVDVNPRRSINGRFLQIRNSPESSLSHRHTQLLARASGCQQMF